MISIAHSPDTDDYFLFWAIVKEYIELEGLNFSFCQHDTALLNRFALEAKFDVSAVSVAVYPQIAERYLILPHGASVGRNYGPVIAAKRFFPVEELGQQRIGIPGTTTTAALVLRSLAPEAQTVEIPIEPYGVMFETLEKGEVDALLLIHEGQLTYTKHNLRPIVDLGKWWQQQTELPLPLGINVIKRDLGGELIEQVSQVLRNSVRYALDHKQTVLEELLELNTRRGEDLTAEDMIGTYLDMYANEDSFQLTEDCKRAIELMLNPPKAGQPTATQIEYAP